MLVLDGDIYVFEGTISVDGGLFVYEGTDPVYESDGTELGLFV